MNEARKNLIQILQNAHAGELAAAFAYRGHWKSLRESDEKKQIKVIETEEWLHRENVRKWLTELDAEPNENRERIFWLIGRSLGVLCYVSGWFFPMYFAGRLESQNILEYEEAAEFARELKMDDCEKEMLEMSQIEAQHETFFRSVVASHRLLPITKRFFRWS